MSKELEAFAQSVLEGLSSERKHLSSRYFYDDEGSRLFQKIMAMPEYYLTNSEYEILDKQSDELYNALGFQEHFNIVELGAGDGQKTICLLDYLSKNNVDFTYVPIDISQGAIDSLEKNISEAIPNINIRSLVGDYFDMLHSLNDEGKPMLILFLGSNIGNYTLDNAHKLIRDLANVMHKHDKLLIGVDLQKNPSVIRRAYDDEDGITKAFNLNLLKRMNRELGANFQLKYWDFYSTYNPINGEVRSFIISLEEQEVHIEYLDKSFEFGQNEWIYTELSRKYTQKEIDSLANNNKLKMNRFFMDEKKYFTDALMERV